MNEAEEFRAYMSGRYGKETADVLVALSISGMMTSVISEFRVRFRTPIAIVANDDFERDLLRNDLRVFDTSPVFSFTDTWKKLLEKIVRCHDDFALIYFQSGAESVKKLQLLAEVVQDGYIEDENINCACVVLFEKFIPPNVVNIFNLIVVVPEHRGIYVQEYDGEVLKKFRRFLTQQVLDKFAVFERELFRLMKTEFFLSR